MTCTLSTRHRSTDLMSNYTIVFDFLAGRILVSMQVPKYSRCPHTGSAPPPTPYPSTQTWKSSCVPATTTSPAGSTARDTNCTAVGAVSVRKFLQTQWAHTQHQLSGPPLHAWDASLGPVQATNFDDPCTAGFLYCCRTSPCLVGRSAHAHHSQRQAPFNRHPYHPTPVP
jgi:hypothetical protein